MPVSLARTRISVPDNVMTRAVGGSTVLLDIDTGRSFTLDAIGSRVWSLLAESGSAHVAYDTLINEFAVEPQVLERDLEALISQLAGQGLLDVTEDRESSDVRLKPDTTIGGHVRPKPDSTTGHA